MNYFYGIQFNYTMNALDPLIAHIQKRVTLTPEELTSFTSAFKLKKIKKKQFIIQPGFPSVHRNYVVKGAFRGYVIGENDGDYTIQLAIEDWWISDYNSYVNRQPATMFVVALEDSTILQIDYDTELKLKLGSHHLETYFRIMAERTAAFQQRRVVAGITQTAEQRYNDFLEKYPHIVQRVPQYALASYLGMSTEFLSRIRNRKTKKKT